MENKLIEHKIKVDNYLDVTLKIPEVMDALELKALATKATKLLNLSNLTENMPKQKYVRSEEAEHEPKKRRKRGKQRSKDDARQIIKETYDAGLHDTDALEKIADKHGFEDVQALKKYVWQRKWYLKQEEDKQNESTIDEEKEERQRW